MRINVAICLLTVLLSRMAHADNAPATSCGQPAAKNPNVKVTISKQTTYITEPLRDDGYPDYIGYVNKKLMAGVTPENNAAVLFWQAIGPAPVAQEHRDEFFKRLGMAPPPQTAATFVNWSVFSGKRPGRTAQERNDVVERQDQATKRPWTTNDDADLAAWLKQNEKALLIITEASKRTQCYHPLISTGEPLLVNALELGAQASREPAKALAARAMLSLGERRPQAAWQDVTTIYRLARLIGRGPMLIDKLVSISMEKIAGNAAVMVVQEGKFTADELARMRADLSTLPATKTAADTLDLERLMYLDAVCSTARLGVSTIDWPDFTDMVKRQRGLLEFAAAGAIEYDVALRDCNRWYDRLLAAFKAPTKAERNTRLAQFENDLRRQSGSIQWPRGAAKAPAVTRATASQAMSAVFVNLMLPSSSAVANAEARSATQAKLVGLAFALERYRAIERSYPRQLSELVPKYVGSVPTDAIADRPFVYRPAGTGYVLYSIGVNAKDDGAVSPNGANDADDIVVTTPDAPRIAPQIKP